MSNNAFNDKTPYDYLKRENRLLRETLRALTEEAHKNEAVLKRFHERELSLLTCDSLPLLLEFLTEGMQESFELPYITLHLLDPAHEYRHLLMHNCLQPENLPLIHFLDQASEFPPVVRHLKKPRLGVYVADNHQRLFSEDAEDVASVALLPMLRNGELVGSINMGSRNPQRFTRHHASDFLNRLATIGAICLENVANREHLLISGLTDALTGLHNRRYLDKRLGEEVARSQRYATPLSALFIDADHFKRINDTHGHSVGDQVLLELSRRIQGCLRASDIATRYGGEEFALILPQTDLAKAKNLAERIAEQVRSLPIQLLDGNDIQLTISIGVSCLSRFQGQPPDTTLAAALLEQADQALYESKRLGRDQVTVASPAEAS